MIPPFVSALSPLEESEEADACCIRVDVELASLTTYSKEGAM
jgi:hypothetical protein